MKVLKLAAALLFIAVLVYFFLFQNHLLEGINVSLIRNYTDQITFFYNENPLTSWVVYIISLIILTFLTVPFTILFVIISGVVVNPIYASLVASLCMSIGTSLSFLVIRYFASNWVLENFQQKLKLVNEHLEKDGFFYVVFIRLIPGIPLFLINALLAVTSLRLKWFFLGTFLGSLFPFYVFAKAGNFLSDFNHISDLYTPETLKIIVLIAVLVVFPILYKRFKPKFI